MAKSVGWIAYFLWGLLCFFIFFHLLFPYEALGRRILYTLEQRTNLVTQASGTDIRLFGIRWARVGLSYTKEKALPFVEIQDWVIQVRPLSLLVGRLSVTSHATVMGGSFHTAFGIERKAHHGLGEWDGIQIDRFPLLWLEAATFGGVASGKALWESAGERFEGEASFELQDGRIENLRLAGLILSPLDLGRIEGQLTWNGERIDLEEISVAGRDLNATLTGSVVIRNPFLQSNATCRLELAPAKRLMDRYPVMQALLGQKKGQSGPVIMRIRGPLEAPQISLTR